MYDNRPVGGGGGGRLLHYTKIVPLRAYVVRAQYARTGCKVHIGPI